MTLIHVTLAFFALAMTILSLWVKRSPWIWGSFLILAFALGYMAKLVQPIALAPVGGLLIVHTFLKGDVRGLARFVLAGLAIALSLGLALRYFPGFTGYPIVEKVKISSDGAPYSLYLNFSKPFIGIFVLAVGFPLVKNLRELSEVMKTAIPMALAGIGIMIFLALYSGLIHFDPKFPSLFWFFLIENLIFVSIIEEAFWRGFVQKELFRAFGSRGALAQIGCVGITALAFAALHYFWVPNLGFLALVLVASIIYGSIYQFTKALEASIFTHWLFNIVHFSLFTYPILQSAV